MASWGLFFKNENDLNKAKNILFRYGIGYDVLNEPKGTTYTHVSVESKMNKHSKKKHVRDTNRPIKDDKILVHKKMTHFATNVLKYDSTVDAIGKLGSRIFKKKFIEYQNN